MTDSLNYWLFVSFFIRNILYKDVVFSGVSQPHFVCCHGLQMTFILLTMTMNGAFQSMMTSKLQFLFPYAISF